MSFSSLIRKQSGMPLCTDTSNLADEQNSSRSFADKYFCRQAFLFGRGSKNNPPFDDDSFVLEKSVQPDSSEPSGQLTRTDIKFTRGTPPPLDTISEGRHLSPQEVTASSSTVAYPITLHYVGSPRKMEFRKTRVFLGREGDFFVTDNKRTVSRKHAQLSWNKTKNTWGLLDLSTNGTFINNRQLPPGSSTLLRNGDRIRLANSDEIEVILPDIDRQPSPQHREASELYLKGKYLRGTLISDEIGRGGFSRVYLGVTASHKRIVIKHIFDKDANQKNLEAFIRDINSASPPVSCEHSEYKLQVSESEFDMVSKFNHPGILKVYGKFSAPAHIFILMEMINGPTLWQMIVDRGRLEPRIVVDIAIQICDILSYLHNLPVPVIYKDMKPINLVITLEDMRVHLLDFGISQYFDPSKEDDKVFYSQGYSPPEQTTCHSTPLSDLYALGVTLYVALTGESVASLSKVNPPYHPKRSTPLPPALDSIIARLTEPDQANRFQSAKQARLALMEVQNMIGKPDRWD